MKNNHRNSLSGPANSTAKGLVLFKSPWLCFLGMAIGLYIGHTWNSVGLKMAVPGDLYLSLLKMNVIPIISTAIMLGLAKMIRSGLAGQYLIKMLGLFIVTMLAASSLGMLAGFLGKPGVELGQVGEAFIGNALLTSTDSSLTHGGIGTILTQMIPANIFNAFSTGNMLKIIFASVLIGGAMGVNQNKSGERLIDVVQGAHEAFLKILSWVLYALPFGLAFMIGGQVAAFGINAMLALGKFVAVFYAAGIVLCIIYLITMRLSTGMPFLQILSALRDPLFVSFSAASSVAPIPIALHNLEKDLGQPKEIVNFVVPLSVAMNRQSNALLFSFTAVFLVQLFGKSLDLGQCITILFTAALLGSAAAGRMAAVAPMIGLVLAPVGLPINVAVILFLTVGAVLDPLIQMTVLFGGCANAAVITNTGLSRKVQPIGQLLVEGGYLSKEQLAEALLQHKDRDKLGQFLIDRGYINEEQLQSVIDRCD